MARASFVSLVAPSAIDNKTSMRTSQRTSSHQLQRREMEMLNLTKPADDFLNFTAHVLANMFPMMEEREFQELKRDIQAQGILEPIRLFEGKILDGRNRSAAAKACGHEFTLADFVQWEGTAEEAEQWVISTNL